MAKMLTSLFDRLETMWHNHIVEKLVSRLLITVFFVGILIVFSNKFFGFKSLGDPLNYFLAIDLAFQVLLILEILGLVFVLPKSVADSMGKQFEILSLVLLRSAFKEFGYMEQPIEWSNLIYEPLLHILSDAFGALVILLIIGIYYRKQRHERITENKNQQNEFINFKKLLSLFLLVVFIYLGVSDLYKFIVNGYYTDSFNTFYTILIFADILILLYSLRYSSRYFNLFRYSSFALATVLIRISLTAPPYLNVLVGTLAGLFVLGLTLMYNYFLENSSTS